MTTITLVPLTAEECKDSYVVTCNPSHPPQPLPECEDGWEFSSTGTAVCASAPPADLATTGPDMNDIGGMVIIGAVLVIGGIALVTALRLRRKGDAE